MSNLNVGFVNQRPTDTTQTVAWANFDGVASTLRESLNLSSLVDDGVGLYDCNYTNPMASAYHHAPAFSAVASFRGMTPLTGYSANECRVRVADDSSASPVDLHHVMLQAAGKLA